VISVFSFCYHITRLFRFTKIATRSGSSFLRAWAGFETAGKPSVQLAPKLEREIVGKYAVLRGMTKHLKCRDSFTDLSKVLRQTGPNTKVISSSPAVYAFNTFNPLFVLYPDLRYKKVILC
jgi:hypothetical protein